jgi:hypothetical protein
MTRIHVSSEYIRTPTEPQKTTITSAIAKTKVFAIAKTPQALRRQKLLRLLDDGIGTKSGKRVGLWSDTHLTSAQLVLAVF